MAKRNKQPENDLDPVVDIDMDTGEDRELTDEQLARRDAKRQEQAGFQQMESDQEMKSDAEANGGATEEEPELAVVGNEGGRPVRENRREARLKAEAERGPLARYEFRLMVGTHSGQDYEQPIIADSETGEPRKDRRRPSRTYKASDRVWDNQDLAKLHNRPNSIKFRLIKDWGSSAYTDGVDPNAKYQKRAGGRPGENIEEDRPEMFKKEDLSDMNLGDLRQFAAREEFDLSGCHTKEEIINALVAQQRKRVKAGV